VSLSRLVTKLDSAGGKKIMRSMKGVKDPEQTLVSYAEELRDARNSFAHSGSVPGDS